MTKNLLTDIKHNCTFCILCGKNTATSRSKKAEIYVSTWKMCFKISFHWNKNTNLNRLPWCSSIEADWNFRLGYWSIVVCFANWRTESRDKNDALTIRNSYYYMRKTSTILSWSYRWRFATILFHFQQLLLR